MAMRQAEAADEAAIAALIDAAYSHYIPIIGRKPRPMLDDHAARIAAGEHHVLESPDGIEAVITLTSEDRPEVLHIFNIAVHPDRQGRGHLRTLLAFAESRARASGKDWLTLYTNAKMVRNRAIYRHLGFAELREEEGNGYRIVFMERALSEPGSH